MADPDWIKKASDDFQRAYDAAIRALDDGDDERRTAPKCSRCQGRGCQACQHTGYAGGREP